MIFLPRRLLVLAFVVAVLIPSLVRATEVAPR
jgi:hypothetical protein